MRNTYSICWTHATLGFYWLALSAGLRKHVSLTPAQLMRAKEENCRPIGEQTRQVVAKSSMAIGRNCATRQISRFNKLAMLLLASTWCTPTSAFLTQCCPGVRDHWPLATIARQRHHAALSSVTAQEQKKVAGPMGRVAEAEKKWEEGFARLEAYQKEHSTCKVPVRFVTADGYKLGAWVKAQREKVNNPGPKRGKLSTQQLSRLGELGFVWDVKTKEWDDNYARLKDCLLEFGDCNVPADYVTPDGHLLGTWLSRQRAKYRGYKGFLTESQKLRLEELGVVLDSQEQYFKEGYHVLEAYKAKYGHCNVPEDFCTEDGYSIGEWVMHFREVYQDFGNYMDELTEQERSQMEAMESIGLVQT